MDVDLYENGPNYLQDRRPILGLFFFFFGISPIKNCSIYVSFITMTLIVRDKGAENS